jgi:hypothetical protein
MKDVNAGPAVQKLFRLMAMGQAVRGINPEGFTATTVNMHLSAYKVLRSDTKRRVRQFADPVVGYTREELEEFTKVCMSNDFAPSFSLMIRLLSVPKKVRQEVGFLVAKNRWGLTAVNAYIKATFGARRNGGRKPKKYTDPKLLKESIKSTASLWCRQSEEMQQDKTSVFHQLSSVFRMRYLDITKMMERIQ